MLKPMKVESTNKLKLYLTKNPNLHFNCHNQIVILDDIKYTFVITYVARYYIDIFIIQSSSPGIGQYEFALRCAVRNTSNLCIWILLVTNSNEYILLFN